MPGASGPTSPPSSTSTLARPPTRVRSAACAAPARCPVSSTAGGKHPCRSPSATASGATGPPAVLKASQRPPARGELMHVDLLRVDLNVAIQASVPVELIGEAQAP